MNTPKRAPLTPLQREEIYQFQLDLQSVYEVPDVKRKRRSQIHRMGIRRTNKTIQQGRISKNCPCWTSSAVKKRTFSSSCNNPNSVGSHPHQALGYWQNIPSLIPVISPASPGSVHGAELDLSIINITR